MASRLPAPVDHAERVFSGEQDRADGTSLEEQGDRMAERAEPDRRHEAGRAEAFPVEQAEDSGCALIPAALALLAGTPAILAAAKVRNPWVLAGATAAAVIVVF